MRDRRRIEKTLVVSTFAPSRCGVGAYATQQVLALRSSDAVVHTIGLLPDSHASAHVDLTDIRSLLAGLFVLFPRFFDQTILHFAEGFFTTGAGSRLRRLTVIALQILFLAAMRFRSRQLVIQVHEIVTDADLGRLRVLARRLLFLLAGRIDFHTERELEDAARYFGWRRDDPKLRLVAHDRFFTPAFEGDKAAARTHLGLQHEGPIFLCIGFIQAHKGFTAAVTAMRASGAQGQLYIVGAPRVPAPEILAYRDELRRLIDAGDGVTFIERFVDDREFDAWIKAADLLVIPYRQIWTTGVGARAGMLGTPVAYRALPTLVEQLDGQEALAFNTDEDLARLLRDFRSARGSPAAVAETPNGKNRKARVLLVAPYLAGGVRGGAEDVQARFAQLLARDDEIDLTVWSTDTTSLARRNHDAPPARPGMGSVRVFACNASDQWIFDLVHRLFARGRSLPPLDWLWCRTSLRGVGMREALLADVDAFDAIYLPHYFYGSTHELAGIAPGKTILHPFIHDEPALSSRPIRDLFTKVSMINVNSEAEIALAQERGRAGPNRFRVIGNCVERRPRSLSDIDTGSLLSDLGLRKGGYVLYVGRVERGKNCHLLAQWHTAFNARRDVALPLVFVGPGSLAHCLGDQDHGPHLVETGFLDADQRDALMASALCLANLSELESFSLVIMESWLAGRPVVINGNCAATREHVSRSGGGLMATDADSYARALEQLIDDDDAAARLGALGAAYVEREFNTAAVYERLKSAIMEVARQGP